MNSDHRTLLAQALGMEIEAAQRYSEFADVMETHNNREVATLFRAMADAEQEHAEQLRAELGDAQVQLIPGGWPGFEAPDAVPVDDLHYLMHPWHALQLALAAEERAERFFARIAEDTSDEDVRNTARSLQHEEAEHVALMRLWLERVPAPPTDWAVDPDPPRYLD